MNAFSNVCFVPYPVVSIQTDNCGNDVIGTIITTNDLGEWGMRINEGGVMMWFVLWPPCWADMIQMDELELSECSLFFLGAMYCEVALIYETLGGCESHCIVKTQCYFCSNIHSSRGSYAKGKQLKRELNFIGLSKLCCPSHSLSKHPSSE